MGVKKPWRNALQINVAYKYIKTSVYLVSIETLLTAISFCVIAKAGEKRKTSFLLLNTRRFTYVFGSA